LRTPVASLHAAGFFLIAPITLYILSGPAPAEAADAFRRLSAAEIRSSIVGKVVTDDSHWSDRFESNGRLDAMELGQRKPGIWKLKGNEMCVTRKARRPVEECFEIWRANDQIEYRRDGVILTSANLRPE
jgi:hypothetical protein